MFNDHYHSVILGKSYISLVYALMRKRKYKQEQIAVIDDVHVKLGTIWSNNIGNIEKSLLKNIGIHYGIQTLVNLDDFVRPINTIIFLNDKMIELGPSPFANIREIARKLPEIFHESYLSSFDQTNAYAFDEMCFAFFDKLATVPQLPRPEEISSMMLLNNNLDKILQDFIRYLQGEHLEAKQLHFVLQVLHQTFFTNQINQLEMKYLLISILSPRYIVDEKSIVDHLVFEFLQQGGRLLTSNVVEWEIYNQATNYLKLASFDGVLHFDKAYYFGRVTPAAPFMREGEETHFHTILLQCPIEHDFIHFFQGKRILICENDRLGTDFPHWELEILENGLLRALYSYAHYEGTKASFYYKKVAEDIFRSLERILPSININDWAGHLHLSEGDDYWLESLSSKAILSEKKIHNDELLYDRESQKVIHNLTYCGPNRTRTLGLYSFCHQLIYSI
jgi:hypothetical protein